MKSRRCLICLAFSALQALFRPCTSRADQGTNNLDLAPESPTFSKGADYSIILPIKEAPLLKREEVGKYIPQDLTDTNDQGQVASRIADRSMSTYLDSPEFKKTEIGHTAKHVEEKMKTDVEIQGEDPMATKHVFKFEMKAANAQALMSYSGFFDAQLSYKATAGTTNFEIFRDLPYQKTKLVYDHTNQPSDVRDVVSLRYLF